MKWVNATEAVSIVQSGNRLFIHSVAMTPHVLIDALVARAHELRHVEIVHIHTEGELPYCKPEYTDAFYPNSFFIGSNMRQALSEGIGDYVPVFLSDISTLFRNRILPIDVAFIQVSPPDQHGYCSLGPSVDVTLSAVETARFVIAQVNPRVPRTHGDGIVHEKDIDFAVWHEADIHEVQGAPITAVEQQIGKHIAALIEDGSTLQTGIGAIPNAVLEQLEHHRDLGVHTEMFSDGLIPLVEKA